MEKHQMPMCLCNSECVNDIGALKSSYTCRKAKEKQMEKKFDPTRPYKFEAKGYTDAEIIHTLDSGDFVVIGKWSNTEFVRIVDKNGRSSNDYHIINIPETIEGWVNVYNYPSQDERIGPKFSIGPIFTDKRHADENKMGWHGGRVACIKISFTSGDGL